MIKGSLVISLDFELMWGLIDVMSKNGYGQSNVKQVPQVIDRMLDLFKKYEVHATFATVGFIMYKDKDSLLHDIPSVHPTYKNQRYSPYEFDYINTISKDEECLFFQPDVVKKLQMADGIEVATHTFCHYYCREDGQTLEQFDIDISKAIEIAKQQGIDIKSIVFPRNQSVKEYLQVCTKYGIKSYRGNALQFYGATSILPDIKNRICRLLNTYINIGVSKSVPYEDINLNDSPVNLRASRALRPYTPKLSFLEGLRLRRIKKEMLYAAKHNEMYHLWWHPHNFGANMDQNFAFLEKVLMCYKECKEKYGMQSYTMNEMVCKLRGESL